MMMMMVVVVTTTTTMTMITLRGQNIYFQIKFCMGENRRPFAWNRDEGFSFF
jgi:hypothetical protein